MKQKDSRAVGIFAVSLAWELGYMIGLPIAILALLGVIADKYFETLPIFTIIGVIIAAITSTIWVRRRINDIQERYMKAVSGSDEMNKQKNTHSDNL